MWQRSALLRGAEVALLSAPMPGPPTSIQTAGRGSAGAAGCGGPRPLAAAPAAAAVAAERRSPEVHQRFPALDRGIRTDDPRRQVLSDFGKSPCWSPSPRGAWPARTPSGGRARARGVPWKTGSSGGGADGRGEPAVRRWTARLHERLPGVSHAGRSRSDRVAPSLVGSPLALARAGITARILLQGKEGTIGLMPPLGAALSDDEIASVLTYVRREWGQTGSPVDAATVKSVRAVTADRRRPWTNAELSAISAAGAQR